MKLPRLPLTLRAASRSRGFTLLELMAVVMIIAVLAVIAVPGASAMIRERRSATAAGYIAQQYRMARARSLGRSSAVLVRFNAGRVTLLEAIAGSGGTNTGCELRPVGACTDAVFSSTNTSRVIDDFNPTGTSYEGVTFQFTQFVGTTATNLAAADVCYSSSGRTWFRAGNAGSFSLMTSAVDIRVRREDAGEVIGVERHIYLLPNGMARLAI